MGADENLAIVRRGYEAFKKGDMETLTELFDEGAGWHAPGRGSLAGDHGGRSWVPNAGCPSSARKRWTAAHAASASLSHCAKRSSAQRADGKSRRLRARDEDGILRGSCRGRMWSWSEPCTRSQAPISPY